jgi:hypothetical protein
MRPQLFTTGRHLSYRAPGTRNQLFPARLEFRAGPGVEPMDVQMGKPDELMKVYPEFRSFLTPASRQSAPGRT